MKIQVIEQKPAVHVVCLDGDFDMSSSPGVRNVLLPLFACGTACHIVIDLSGVPYIDSSGIATLVEGLHLSKKGKVRFTLAGAGQAVETVFDLAYLKDVFEMVPDVCGLLGEGEESR